MPIAVDVIALEAQFPDLALAALTRTLEHTGLSKGYLVLAAGSMIEGAAPSNVVVLHRDEITVGDPGSADRFGCRQLNEIGYATHQLLVRWDAYALYAGIWSDAFCGFDYIGTRGAREGDEAYCGGRGGFQLRSRRFNACVAELATNSDRSKSVELQPAIEPTMATTAKPLVHLEDVLDSDFGLLAADVRVTDSFVFGSLPPRCQSVGFTGLAQFWRALGEDEMTVFAQSAPVEIVHMPGFMHLALQSLGLGRMAEGEALAKRILQEDAHPSLRQELDAALAQSGVGTEDDFDEAVSKKHIGEVLAQPMDDRLFGAEHVEALQSVERECMRIFSRYPEDPDAMQALGILARRLREPGRAMDLLWQALQQQPNSASILIDYAQAALGCAYYQHGLAAAQLCAHWAPDHSGVQHVLANALNAVGQRKEALAIVKSLLQKQPEDPSLALSLGFLQLAEGNYADGFKGYEYRLHLAESKLGRVPAHIPPWRGEFPPPRRMLVVSEQALGDNIMFGRFVPWLAAQGCDVTFATRKPLIGLFQDAFPAVHTIEHTQALLDAPADTYDAWVAVCSLPHRLGITVDHPQLSAPYLVSQETLAALWQTRMDAHFPRVFGTRRPRVGIVWRGQEVGKDSAQSTRTLQQRDLRYLLHLGKKHVDWVSLQHDGEPLGLDCVYEPGALTSDFRHAAALIQQLDWVVSVDTGLAHLAGALGQSCWVMLPPNPEWRYEAGRQHNPWYGEMRIFRQHPGPGWRGLLDEVIAALASQAALADDLAPCPTIKPLSAAA